MWQQSLRLFDRNYFNLFPSKYPIKLNHHSWVQVSIRPSLLYATSERTGYHLIWISMHQTLESFRLLAFKSKALNNFVSVERYLWSLWSAFEGWPVKWKLSWYEFKAQKSKETTLNYIEWTNCLNKHNETVHAPTASK